MVVAFQLFGPSHIGALIVIAMAAAFLVRQCRKDLEGTQAKVGICILTFLCFAIYPMNQAFLSIIGGSDELNNLLPFHLCDIAAIICGFAILTRRPLLCELAYFWGLAGTLQGLLTPDLNHDFPSPVYILFFLHHGAVVITALLLPLGLGWRPRHGAFLRVFLWVLIYAAAAFLLNFVLGTNFGYLMHKPEHASLLDIMGPWPWYIVILIAMAGLLFYLLSFPFRKAGKSDPVFVKPN